MAGSRQHALVTGGSRGIGRAVAAALARAGACVTVLGRSEGPLREVVAAAEAMQCAVADVTDPAALSQALDAVVTAHGPIEILVNNAGSVESGPFAKLDPGVFNAMWNV